MARIENLYLLTGNNEWEKRETLRKLLTHLSPEGPSSVDYEVLEGGGGKFDPGKVLSDLFIIPFASRPRLILIKDVEKTPPIFQSRLLETLTRLPKGTTCVLETKEAFLRGPFFEKLVSLAKCLLFREPKGEALLSWMDRRATFYGKRISPSARALLLEKVGTNLLRLDKALEALASYVGEKSSIDEREVEALLGVSLTHTRFELARAVAGRETLKALEIFSHLISEREKPHEIVGALGWQLRRLLRAKELLEEGISPREVGARLRLRWEEQKNFFDALSRFERSELEKGLRELLEVDHRLKTGIGEGKEAVEQFVLGLCR